MIRISRRVASSSESATLALTARVQQLKRQGADVVSFGAGEPDFPTPAPVKAAAIRAIEGDFTKYTPSSGIPELREAIARRFRDDYGLEYAPSQVLVSCGAKHSLYNALHAVCEEGDEVLIPAPYWVSYPDMVRLTGATPVIVPTSPERGFKATVEDLERVATPRTRLLVLNSPSNPTGAVYSAPELEPIGEFLARREILALCDDIYACLVYGGRRFESLPSVCPAIRPLSIVVNGVSKAFSMTGWRIGWAAGPAEVIEAMGRLQGQTTSNPASISQKAALAAVTGDPAVVAPMVAEFDARRRIVVEGLNRIPGVRCHDPEGSFYCFPEISRLLSRRRPDGSPIGTSERLAEAFLEDAGIAVVPGGPFGAPNHLRFSFAISSKEIERGLDRLAAYVAKLR